MQASVLSFGQTTRLSVLFLLYHICRFPKHSFALYCKLSFFLPFSFSFPLISTKRSFSPSNPFSQALAIQTLLFCFPPFYFLSCLSVLFFQSICQPQIALFFTPLHCLILSRGFSLLFRVFPAYFVLFVCPFYGCALVFPCQIVVCLCSPLFHPVCKPVPVSFFSFPSVAFVAPHTFALFSSTLPRLSPPGAILRSAFRSTTDMAASFPCCPHFSPAVSVVPPWFPEILHTKKPQSVSALRPFALIFLILPRNPEFLSSRLCPYEQIPSQRRLPPAALRR